MDQSRRIPDIEPGMLFRTIVDKTPKTKESAMTASRIRTRKRPDYVARAFWTIGVLIVALFVVALVVPSSARAATPAASHASQHYSAAHCWPGPPPKGGVPFASDHPAYHNTHSYKVPRYYNGKLVCAHVRIWGVVWVKTVFAGYHDTGSYIVPATYRGQQVCAVKRLWGKVWVKTCTAHCSAAGCVG